MIKQLTLVLSILAFALSASAQQEQYSYNFTSPVGAVTCQNVNPYLQWYQNLVENSTPAYPNALQPFNFHMPDKPNHPFPVDNACGVMVGFVGDNGAKMSIEFGGGPPSNSGRLNITSANGVNQVVIFDNGVWSGPNQYPAEGQSVAFTLEAQITQVCNAICTAATGQLTLTGSWAFGWTHHVQGRYNAIYKAWTNTTPVVVNGLSTVAILDQDQHREQVTIAEFRWPSWLRWLFGASEPVEIFF